MPKPFVEKHRFPEDVRVAKTALVKVAQDEIRGQGTRYCTKKRKMPKIIDKYCAIRLFAVYKRYVLQAFFVHL